MHSKKAKKITSASEKKWLLANSKTEKEKKIQKDTRLDSNLSLSFDKLLSNLSHDNLKEAMKVFEKDKIDIFTKNGV